jgi:glycosyltransferase involved in cell wall biosynthesis
VFSTGADVRSFKLAYTYLKYAFKNKFTHIFCREEKLLFFMLVYRMVFFWKRNMSFVFEVHDLNNRDKVWYKFILARTHKIVVITEGLKKILVDRGVDGAKVVVAPDAVDLEKFDIDISKGSARQKLGIDQNKKVVLYTGSLEAWKGVDTLYKASNHFDDEVLFMVVGGRNTWVKEFEGWYPLKNNFEMLGHKDHSLIPLYLKSADILVIPNSAKVEISNTATSPMKLFEYMASGRPIVASDIPSIREVLNPESAFLFNPDDELSLASMIRKALNNNDLGLKLALVARESVKKYTWHARAQKILNHIK